MHHVVVWRILLQLGNRGGESARLAPFHAGTLLHCLLGCCNGASGCSKLARLRIVGRRDVPGGGAATTAGGYRLQVAWRRDEVH